MLFERISAVELKQLEFQKKTEEKFDEVFEYISNHAESEQKIFNAQYPKLEVKMTNAFHDRFMVLDDKTVYHIGDSINDAGKKCFGIIVSTQNTRLTPDVQRIILFS